MTLMKMQKKKCNNIVGKMNDPMNLEVVNLKNINRKKVKEKNTSTKSSVELYPFRINH